MANINQIIRQGIYTRLVGATNTFRTAITLSGTYYKLFYHIAPQLFPGTTTAMTLPYVVFDFLPINQEKDSANKYYDLIIQFNVASNTQTDCENISGYLFDRLEDSESSLSFTGYENVIIKREPYIPPFLVDNVWNATVQYRLEIQI